MWSGAIRLQWHGGRGSESGRRNRELRRGTERTDDGKAQRRKRSEKRERVRRVKETCKRDLGGKWEMKGGRAEMERKCVHGGDSPEHLTSPSLW